MMYVNKGPSNEHACRCTLGTHKRGLPKQRKRDLNMTKKRTTKRTDLQKKQQRRTKKPRGDVWRQRVCDATALSLVPSGIL